MGLFFGTDGLRGIVNEDLTYEIAYKCGNALSMLKDKPKILVGRDSRVSGEYLTLALSLGAMSGGANVTDIGVVPTAGVAYLTKFYGADYGVVISASHNPKEYNGIKVFSSEGYKLSEKEEENIERCFIKSKVNESDGIGHFEQNYNAIKDYGKFLVKSCGHSLKGLTVVLDGANGAASRIAPAVFKELGANVIATNCSVDGNKINDKCGALYPDTLAKRMKRYSADIGFAFDGDADRLISVCADGKIIDGDMAIYVIACYLKEKGKLNHDVAVGTSHTNMAIEKALNDKGISFVRTDIGDKYVLAKLIEKGYSVGGEQSGHIILKDIHTTGDGILSAIYLANVMIEKGKSLQDLVDVKLFPQANVNIIVSDKYKVINNEEFNERVDEAKERIKDEGRIMVRASGTEPKIRIMVESGNQALNEELAHNLAEAVKKADAI